jgi:uncharacterized protein YnzC (UPF0291/DUF896 family)
MAKRKARKLTAEELAERQQFMERFRARIREREAIDEQIAREHEQHRQA